MAATLRSWFRSYYISPIFHGVSTTFKNCAASMVATRNFNVTKVMRNEENSDNNGHEEDGMSEEAQGVDADQNTETSEVVDVDTSIRYLNSEAFVKGYHGKPVWFYYRRNFKGWFPPKTRRNCLRKGQIQSASPCPVCRDKYLVLDVRNVKLLEQFISPYTGEIMDSRVTGVCQKQHQTLVAEVMKAWNEGRIEKKLPFRAYNYKDYIS